MGYVVPASGSGSNPGSPAGSLERWRLGRARRSLQWWISSSLFPPVDSRYRSETSCYFYLLLPFRLPAAPPPVPSTIFTSVPPHSAPSPPRVHGLAAEIHFSSAPLGSSPLRGEGGAPPSSSFSLLVCRLKTSPPLLSAGVWRGLNATLADRRGFKCHSVEGTSSNTGFFPTQWTSVWLYLDVL